MALVYVNEVGYTDLSRVRDIGVDLAEDIIRKRTACGGQLRMDHMSEIPYFQ
jgi:hypothetical protein